jgi:diaminopimelate decarboxylase
LVGPICHTGDTLYNASYLPELERGDELAIMDSGAYFIADATSFSFPQPAIIAIDATGEEVLVRKAESFEHLVSLDQFSAGQLG